jgi:CheY-like chemotaxis protein
MKILAVDDDEIVLELLQVTMEAEGFTDVTLASSGRQALNVIRDTLRPFDCILLDIQMPRMDGIELCGKIRRANKYKKTPIIMITAMSEKKYVDRAFKAGATDYVTKPFDVLELGTRIKMAQRLCEERKISQERTYAIEVLKDAIEKGDKCDIGEPVDIEDVNGVINYFAFENYLLQLTRGILFTSSVFAIKIENISSIYTRSSPSEFKYTLTDISEAISENLIGTESLISYRGSGIFICVCHRGDGLEREELEAQIRNSIVELDLIYSSGASLKVNLTVSGIKKSGVFTKLGTLSLQTRAIEDVEVRGAARKSQKPVVPEYVLSKKTTRKPLLKAIANILVGD